MSLVIGHRKSSAAADLLSAGHWMAVKKMLGNTDDFVDETAGTVVSRGIEDGWPSTVERGYFEMSIRTTRPR